MRTTKEMRGTRVLGGKKGNRKIGKITTTVFYPREPRVVGYVVKRPDFLWMIKRKDKFLAFDAMALEDGRAVATMGADSWDDAAIKRLGINYDTCVIWENMPIKTEDGYEMGYVGVVKYNDKTGKIISLTATDGAIARAILGTYEIPVNQIRGYGKGFLVVTLDARNNEASGGVAAKAGAATAKTSQGAKNVTKKAGSAINDGAYALGGLIGKAKKSFAPDEEDAAVVAKPAAAANPAATNAAAVVAKPAATANPAATNAAAAVAKPAVAASPSATNAAAAASPAAAKPAAETKKAQPLTQTAARSLGKQLGKSKGMFAAFKDEYKKGVSGDD